MQLRAQAAPVAPRDGVGEDVGGPGEGELGLGEGG